MSEATATRRIFAFTTSRALSACLTAFYEYFTLSTQGGGTHHAAKRGRKRGPLNHQESNRFSTDKDSHKDKDRADSSPARNRRVG